ncbi:MAG: hypothetical protein AAGD25_20755 [Cyanobacteria bacterium P01_F01_bin.150]
MQISENPSNQEIRDVLIQLNNSAQEIRDALLQLNKDMKENSEKLSEELGNKIERLEYKFDVYQKGTDGMVKMATTIIIAAASVVFLSSLSPAITAVVTALSASNVQ